MKKAKTEQEDKKKQIKQQLEKALDLSKNLQQPRNIEEQQMLDNIMNEINKLNDYIDVISNDAKNKND